MALNLILDLRHRNGLTVLFISHNLGVIKQIADCVGVLYGGKLNRNGSDAEVLHYPQHEYSQHRINRCF